MEFLPSIPIVLSFALASVLLAITPGPDMAFFLGRTLHGGRRLGLVALLGTMTGLLCHAVLAALGLSTLLAASASLFLALKILGCGYLLWLAVQALRHGSAFSVLEESGGAHGAIRAYLSGIGINLFNPKVVLFFVTFLPQFVNQADPHAAAKMMFLSLLFIGIGMIICVGIIFGAGRFIAACKANHKIMRYFDYGFAGLMGLFAGKLLISSTR